MEKMKCEHCKKELLDYSRKTHQEDSVIHIFYGGYCPDCKKKSIFWECYEQTDQGYLSESEYEKFTKYLFDF